MVQIDDCDAIIRGAALLRIERMILDGKYHASEALRIIAEAMGPSDRNPLPAAKEVSESQQSGQHVRGEP